MPRIASTTEIRPCPIDVLYQSGIVAHNKGDRQGMIPKSGHRFSEKIMPTQ